jgi:hypothetical protein
MPEYMLLIYVPADNPLSPEDMAEMSTKWDEYTENLHAAGVYVGGNALQGTDVATTVRERDGQVQITDGPFAETKEVLGGYYLLDAPDLDTVLEHAARIPNIAYGSTEVRPVLDMAARQSAAAQARASA